MNITFRPVAVAAALLGVSLALSACAAKPNWTRPGGVKASQLDADWTYCRAEANEAAGVRVYDGDLGGTGRMSTIEAKRRKDAFDRTLSACMSGLGYRQTKS